MKKSLNIPDEKSREKSVNNLRKVKQDLELLGLEIDELLAMANLDLSRQSRQRLEKLRTN